MQKNHAILLGVASHVAKQVCLGPVKGNHFNTDFVAKKSTTPLYFLEDLFTTSNNLISFKAGLICAGFYLEFIVWRRSHEWPKDTSFLEGPGASPPPPKIFRNEYALRCSLVHFEAQF